MATIAEALELGLQHHQSGRLPQAEQIYRQILDVQPQNADAAHLLGALALQTGRLDESLQLLERAVTSDPSIAVYHGNLGSAYLTAGRYEDARRALSAAVARDPDFADGYYNLGVTLYNLGRIDEAEACYRRSLELRPGDPTTHNNLADLLRELGRPTEALVHLDQALALDPEFAKARYNRALVWLSQGRMPEAWREYEWRWRCREFDRRQLPQPMWDGQPLRDQTLLIHAEQGWGDTLQFIRYLPWVRQRVPHTLVEVQAGLLPLLERSGFHGLIAQRAPLPPIDVQLPMVGLPALFDTTLDHLPVEVPYLRPDPKLVEQWRHTLSQIPAWNGRSPFRVGIAWQGNPTYREDRYRSIPLAFFAPLAQVPGVQLINLQKGPGREQISQLRGQFHVLDLGSAVDEAAGPFMDTAAIMHGLDLVVTSDTAVAHLAGGLGVPVWVPLRLGPDWRWLLDRSDSPWYPTMRLFRQTRFNDWAPVFNDLAAELAKMTNSAVPSR